MHLHQVGECPDDRPLDPLQARHRGSVHRKELGRLRCQLTLMNDLA